jgi:hypothetical protein
VFRRTRVSSSDRSRRVSGSSYRFAAASADPYR